MTSTGSAAFTDVIDTSSIAAEPSLEGIPQELLSLITAELLGPDLRSLSMTSYKQIYERTSIESVNRSKVLIDFRDRLDDLTSEGDRPSTGYAYGCLNEKHRFLTLVLGSKLPLPINRKQLEAYMTYVDLGHFAQGTASRGGDPLDLVQHINTSVLIFSRPITRRYNPSQVYLPEPSHVNFSVKWLVQIIPSEYTASPSELGCPKLEQYCARLGYIFPSHESLSAHTTSVARVLIEKPYWVGVDLVVLSGENGTSGQQQHEDRIGTLEASMISQGQSKEEAAKLLRQVSWTRTNAEDWSAYGHALREQERVEQFKLRFPMSSQA